MHTSRVAHPSVAQNLVTAFCAFYQSIDYIESEYRRQLLHGKWIVAADSCDIRNQATRSRRHGDAGQLRDHFDRPSNDSGIKRTLWGSNDLTKLISFRLRNEVRALCFKLFSDGLFNWGIAHHSLFGSANCPIVKTLARENVLHCLGNVGSSFNKHWHISRANSERGFA
jgi:hypothetical protein